MSLSHSPKIVTDGLILYLDSANCRSYPGSGTVWNDLSVTGNTCTLVNSVSLTSGRMYFDGNNSYVSIANDSIYNNLSNITLESWFQPHRTSSYEYLFSNARDCCGVYYGYELRYYYSRAYWTIWNSGGYTTSTPVGSIQLNNTYHIAATYNGNQSNIYINGELSGTNSINVGIGKPSSYNLYIGRMGLNQIYEYQGYNDISKIYNRALTPLEIRQNFNALRGRFGI